MPGLPTKMLYAALRLINLYISTAQNSRAANFYSTFKNHIEKELGVKVSSRLKRYRAKADTVVFRQSGAEAFGKSGFSDHSNFIRAFKKAFGIPPGKYSR